MEVRHMKNLNSPATGFRSISIGRFWLWKEPRRIQGSQSRVLDRKCCSKNCKYTGHPDQSRQQMPVPESIQRQNFQQRRWWCSLNLTQILWKCKVTQVQSGTSSGATCAANFPTLNAATHLEQLVERPLLVSLIMESTWATASWIKACACSIGNVGNGLREIDRVRCVSTRNCVWICQIQRVGDVQNWII